MTFKRIAFTLESGGKRTRSIDRLLEIVMQLPKEKEFTVEVDLFRKRRSDAKNKLLNAHLRDIARWRHGGVMTVPDKVFDNVVNDFKASDVWPRYSDPEPDYMTGEQLYRAKSRRDLTQLEASGIVNWLTVYMRERDISSHAPEQDYG